MLNEKALSRSSLCVVGNLNRDLRTSPLTPGDRLFRDGETSIPSLSETIGGGGANSALAAAALGARVTLLARVGSDALGDRLERTLRQHGVDTRLARDPRNPSGTSIALMFDTGHRHFVSCLPANHELQFEDLDLSCLENCDHLFRADVWFSESMLNGGNRALFEAARSRGIPVSLDINWDPAWGRDDPDVVQTRKQRVRSDLPLVDVVHGNIRELCEFTGASDLEPALEKLSEWGAAAVVVHMGEHGAGFFTWGQLHIQPPVPARRQVHATGTGDVLSVCMMLLHQQTDAPIADRLRLANTIVAEYIEGRRAFTPELAE